MANEASGCVGCLVFFAVIYVVGFIFYFFFSMFEGEFLLVALVLLFVGCVKFLSFK
jgi:hypothetical protein